MNKKFLFVAIPVLIIIGFLVYRNYNSVENKTRRTVAREAISWFSISESQDSEESIKLKRITYNLSDDWYFEYENHKLHEITYSEYLINQDYFFRNSRTDELRIYSTLYYFGLDVSQPVPLKSKIAVVLEKNSKIIDEKYLWEGDFDAFCKKP